MFVGLAAGSFAGAMFHLMTHAFFKALLFLAAGSIIHALSGEQDIRYMGGLRKKIPWTYLLFLAGVLAISGIPPFSGFFSKDEILAAAFSKSPALWIIGLVVSALTASYIFRLFWLGFAGKYRGPKINLERIQESPGVMLIPMAALAVLAVIGGLPAILHSGARNALEAFLDPVFRNTEEIIHHGSAPLSEETGAILIIATLAAIGVSICITWFIFVRKKQVPASDSEARRGFVGLARNRFYLDELYDALLIKPLYRLSDFLRDIVDIKIFDRIVESAGRFVMFAGSRIRLLQTGNVGFYLFAMVVCIIFVLLLNLLR